MVGRRGAGTLTRSSFCGLDCPETAALAGQGRCLRHRMAQRMRALRSQFGGPRQCTQLCRRGLHSYKAATRESTSGMRGNEKFAEALRFFILDATHALRSCHTSETCRYRDQRAASLRASLHALGCAGRVDLLAAASARRGPDASRVVTKTCRDVSLPRSADQVASIPACGHRSKALNRTARLRARPLCCGRCFQPTR